MGKTKKHLPVKVITGFIYRDIDFFYLAKKSLERKFGLTDYESQELNFNRTDYYNKEFGCNLKKRISSFKKLLYLDNIEKIKVFTNCLEKRFSANSHRNINIDPGYITDAKLVLLTTKDYFHRIYLRSEIYAEVTLAFRNGTFEGFNWTYPDYKLDYINVFNSIRELYLKDLKVFKR